METNNLCYFAKHYNGVRLLMLRLIPLSSVKRTHAVVEELHEIRDRIDGLIETLELSSDRKFLAEIKESLKEAEQGQGRPIAELIKELERLTST